MLQRTPERAQKRVSETDEIEGIVQRLVDSLKDFLLLLLRLARSGGLR
jgi:hypothetical protein